MMDDASSNKWMITIMTMELKGCKKNFNSKHHVPCFAHILNLIVQAMMKSFSISPEMLAEETKLELLIVAD